MKFDKKSLLLYAVTDRSWLDGRTLLGDVEHAITGGATFVQLREKDLPYEKFCREALEIGALCRARHVPFVINDNVEVALAFGADGVHVGQHDMSARDVRRLIGADRILGVSAQTVEQALLAESQGADYLGVGSVFPTSTKLDADAVSFEPCGIFAVRSGFPLWPSAVLRETILTGFPAVELPVLPLSQPYLPRPILSGPHGTARFFTECTV